MWLDGDVRKAAYFGSAAIGATVEVVLEQMKVVEACRMGLMTGKLQLGSKEE